MTKLLDNNEKAFEATRVPMLELLKQLSASSDARHHDEARREGLSCESHGR